MADSPQAGSPKLSTLDRLRRDPRKLAWELDSLLDECRQDIVDALALLIDSGDSSVGILCDEYLRSLTPFPEIEVPPDPRIILTSQSPRRRRILALILQSDDFSIEPVAIEETEPTGANPGTCVLVIAIQKILAFARTHWHNLSGNEVVVAADTLVCTENGHKQGKYNGAANPLQKLLSFVADADSGYSKGRTLKAYTGLVVMNARTKSFDYTSTEAEMTFHSPQYAFGPEEMTVLRDICTHPEYADMSALLSHGTVRVRDVLEMYVSSDKHEGKAGGFNIEDRDFFLCVKSLGGDPFTVIGLPFGETQRLLERNGVKTQRLADLTTIWPHTSERQIIFKGVGDERPT